MGLLKQIWPYKIYGCILLISQNTTMRGRGARICETRMQFYTFHDRFSKLPWPVQNFDWLDDFNKDKDKKNIDEIWITSL